MGPVLGVSWGKIQNKFLIPTYRVVSLPRHMWEVLERPRLCRGDNRGNLGHEGDWQIKGEHCEPPSRRPGAAIAVHLQAPSCPPEVPHPPRTACHARLAGTAPGLA